MCGINGFNWKDQKTIKKMNNSLKHRGPNDNGTYLTKNISLGHRRLSILDLSSAGHQPMEYTHNKKKGVIVFNGEIYNFQEIKKTLLKKGYAFKSTSDTEVILASYLEWGEKCVDHFNGMWAFCIYDVQKNQLFLSRDRLGQKPLYYFHNQKKFIFSSELKGILEHNLKPTLNKDSIDLYFSLGFIPSPYTIYTEIKKLKPGENLIYDLKKNSCKEYIYFQKPSYQPKYNKKELIKETKELLHNATQVRMIADVPVGAFLSGGIDSSLIVKNMTYVTDKKNLNTFSIGFEEKYDETKEILITKKACQTNHHHKYFKETDFKKILKDIFYYNDEPFADPSLFPTSFLSEFARQTVTVSLSGDGGDEIFGGYPRHQKARQIESLKKIPSSLRKQLYTITKGKIKEGLKVTLLPKYQIFSEARDEIYKPRIFKKISEETMKECLSLANNNLPEAVLLYDRYFNTLADNFLYKVDRASMSHNLEVRSPFLDYRFLELSAKIPTKYKFSLTKNKILLREIASEFLPKSITKKKKAGFTPPIQDWLLESKYKEQIKKMLEELYKKGILTKEWYVFYKQTVFNRNDIIFQNYIMRLYFFYLWAKEWNVIR